MPTYQVKRNLGDNLPEGKEGDTIELGEEAAAPLIVRGLLTAEAKRPAVKAPRKPAKSKTKDEDQ